MDGCRRSRGPTETENGLSGPRALARSLALRRLKSSLRKQLNADGDYEISERTPEEWRWVRRLRCYLDSSFGILKTNPSGVDLRRNPPQFHFQMVAHARKAAAFPRASPFFRGCHVCQTRGSQLHLSASEVLSLAYQEGVGTNDWEIKKREPPVCGHPLHGYTDTSHVREYFFRSEKDKRFPPQVSVPVHQNKRCTHRFHQTMP